MKKIRKVVIWLIVLSLLFFGIRALFSKKDKTPVPVKKEVIKLAPKKAVAPQIISHPTTMSCWQIGQDFIDSIFADHPRYSSSDYNDNGVFDAERWCNRTGKLNQLAKFCEQYNDEIHIASNSSGLGDTKLLCALVAIESGGDRYAANPNSSAKGLGQLINSTSRNMGVDDVYDPQQNLNGTAKYLKLMLDTFNGNIDKAILAYYYGPQGAANKIAGGFNPTDEEYVQKIKYLYTHS
ncbi:MAG: lytic transglycosylase domain-containing protein [Candidatus Falkowbacteria bacterium]